MVFRLQIYNMGLVGVLAQRSVLCYLTLLRLFTYLTLDIPRSARPPPRGASRARGTTLLLLLEYPTLSRSRYLPRKRAYNEVFISPLQQAGAPRLASPRLASPSSPRLCSSNGRRGFREVLLASDQVVRLTLQIYYNTELLLRITFVCFIIISDNNFILGKIRF